MSQGAVRRWGPGGLAVLIGALTMAAMPPAAPSDGAAPSAQRRADPPYVVVAVGDIACPPGRQPTATTCRQRDTAELTERIDPQRVLALGDLQYESGALADFQSAYDASWGPLKPVTLPIPGNHEYSTPGATGYYAYFADRQPGAPGYYSRRLGAWTVYALNSMCDENDCAKQEAWLRRELQGDTRCSMAIWHHPRFFSNDGGDVGRPMHRFFKLLYESGVEMVVSGHRHNYERLRPMGPSGVSRPAKGVTQLISGGGGKDIRAPTTIAEGSRSVIAEFGVLRLALRNDSYRTSFRGIDGSVQDPYRAACHAPPP